MFYSTSLQEAFSNIRLRETEYDGLNSSLATGSAIRATRGDEDGLRLLVDFSISLDPRLSRRGHIRYWGGGSMPRNRWLDENSTEIGSDGRGW